MDLGANTRESTTLSRDREHRAPLDMPARMPESAESQGDAARCPYLLRFGWELDRSVPYEQTLFPRLPTLLNKESAQTSIFGDANMLGSVKRAALQRQDNRGQVNQASSQPIEASGEL